jgi:antitoxin ParD1/3/4
MTFSLSAQLEELIRRKVNAGQYESPAQVIEEALQLLEERDIMRDVRRDRLQRELANGVFEADNRQLIDGAQVFRGLMTKASASDQ